MPAPFRNCFTAPTGYTAGACLLYTSPPPAYFDFIRELHGIGNNLNQIAQKAHVLGVIDERRYDEEVKKFDRLVREITKAVILPRPME